MEPFDELVDRVKKQCADNLPFVERRLTYMKSMKRQHQHIMNDNLLTYDDIIRAWSTAIAEYKKGA